MWSGQFSIKIRDIFTLLLARHIKKKGEGDRKKPKACPYLCFWLAGVWKQRRLPCTSPGQRKAHAFFPRGNQKTEGKRLEIYKEVYYKTEDTMKILNVKLRVNCSFPHSGPGELWFTLSEQKGFFIPSLWGLTCGTRACGLAQTHHFCPFPFTPGDANNIPQDAAVPTAFQCNSYGWKNLALLILQ